MKQLKFFLLLLIGMIALTTLNSCETEDFGNQGGGGKRLVKITNAYHGANLTFHYKNGKLSKITDRYDDDSVADINYNGKIVRIVSEDIEGTLQLNNDGYAKSLTSNDYYEINFEYSNGYLTKLIYSDEDNVSGTVNIQYDTNGNLLTMSEIINEFGSVSENKYTFTSSNYPLKGKSYSFLMYCDFEFLFPLYYAGLLGKDPKNLLSKIDIKETYNGHVYNNTYTFDYLFYDDGYVNKITRNSESMVLTYE